MYVHGPSLIVIHTKGSWLLWPSVFGSQWWSCVISQNLKMTMTRRVALTPAQYFQQADPEDPRTHIFNHSLEPVAKLFETMLDDNQKLKKRNSCLGSRVYARKRQIRDRKLGHSIYMLSKVCCESCNSLLLAKRQKKTNAHAKKSNAHGRKGNKGPSCPSHTKLKLIAKFDKLEAKPDGPKNVEAWMLKRGLIPGFYQGAIGKWKKDPQLQAAGNTDGETGNNNSEAAT